MEINTLDIDTQSLRERILNLAIRGKLLQQNPTDESASVLLKKIKTEQVKEKKRKTPTKITENEELFEIPDSWKWTRLGDIGIWAAGATPSRKHPEYYGGNIPWLKTGDLTDGIVNTTSEKITELGVKNSSVKLNKPGNVLIAMYGATIGKLGIVGDKEMVTNQACCGCNLFDGVYNWYLFYYLLASRRRLIKLGSGGAQPNISKKKIENFIFALPPLAEQKRIADKISQLFEQIDKIESASQQYTELQSSLRSKVLDVAMQGKLVKQDSADEPASVLLDKIKSEKDELIKEKKIKKSKPLPEITDDEKLFDIPDSWEWVRLGDIGVWAAGATPSRKHPEYYGGNIPWLKTGDLTDGVVNTTSEKITELGVKNSSVKLNKPGNVLIAMYGATIGKLGIVGDKEIVTNQACCGCNLFDGVYNWYLFYYLLASRRRLIKLGSGGAQPNISKKKIENFVFPVPPLEEQKRIVNKIEKVFSSL